MTVPFRPATTTNEQEKEDSEDDIYENIEKYNPDKFNEEVITSLRGNNEYLETISVQELEGAAAGTDIHGQRSRETEDSTGTEITNEEDHNNRKLTYKVPEKLLKRSKFTQKQEQGYQSDIDIEDSDDEIMAKKRKKKGEAKEWNRIQELMKEKELSVDDYKIGTSTNKTDSNNQFKVV
ncbi:hypothetical protein MACK_002561 [Theileria orientalis]|uniref:Uncharacterized protein n=1 Tax=Theileria orientalis TaxID=68886 RepID=A0A976MF04_THEOR|nr:hypothetical protein MACK_002561 [Theileria orientalis]